MSNEYIKLSEGRQNLVKTHYRNYLKRINLRAPDANESEEAHKQLQEELDEYYKIGKIKRAKVRSR